MIEIPKPADIASSLAKRDTGLAKVLLVDDAREMLTINSIYLRKLGYEVVEAENGHQALAALHQESIQLVLTDWMMPEMDGIELCKKIRAVDWGRYIYVILLTGRGGADSLIEGMDAGADDFLTKPISREELRVRLRAGERILELEQRLAYHARTAQEAHAKLAKDLEVAAKLQAQLIPDAHQWGDYRFDNLYQPSAFVAGDMFGYFELSEAELGFYHLDVSGHGVPASLLSYTLNNVLSLEHGNNELLIQETLEPPFVHAVEPDRVINELNNRFAGKGSDSDQYFTMVYGVLDRASGALRFCQAGHPAPLIVRGRGGEVESVGDGGIPVGMLPGMDYDTTQSQLEPGDRMYIYSDGITECPGPDEQLYGDERFHKLLQKLQDEPLADVPGRILDVLQTWNPGLQEDDDITLIVIERASK